MKKIFIALATLIFAGAFIIISCTKHDSLLTDVDNQVKQIEKEAVTEAVLQKIDDLINREISNLENNNYNILAVKSEVADPCNPKIIVETPANSKFPKTITLDWGTGCTDNDKNFRAGKVVVHITGPYWEKNTVRHSKLVDYRYNDLKVEGDRNEINKGPNDKGFIVFDINHSEKIKDDKGNVIIERDLKRTRTCNRGKDLKTTDDDEIWISGTATVKNLGKERVQEITTPLYRKLTCQHIQSGIITTYVNKVKVAELNYGKGDCDNIATWTNGKVTKDIILKTGVNYYTTKP
jgi:hypothetical protein